MPLEFPEKIDIARLPTPITKLTRLSELFGGPDIYIKRDDLTGLAVSGNKVRKLEFSAGLALKNGCDTLITCGGLQSNHCRATAAVAALLGLKSHLVLVGEKPEPPQGNVLINLMMGAEITYLPGQDLDGLTEAMNRIAAGYEAKGNKPFIIPMGASDATGALGYVNAVVEMTGQFAEMNFIPDDIIVATGSGGTQAGLVIGRALFGLTSRIQAVNVRCDEKHFVEEITKIMDEFEAGHGVDLASARKDISLIDGYVGDGYALCRPEVLRFIARVARTEGILLDPVYTGKAMYGLYREIEKGNFKKGQKVLFIHTGGAFSLFKWAERFSRDVFSGM